MSKDPQTVGQKTAVVVPAETPAQVIGYVHFDSYKTPNYKSEVLVDQVRADAVIRNKYAKIASQNGRTFIGRIVEGPFFMPQEMKRESAMVMTPILRGEKFHAIPKYFALTRIELLGEYVEGHLVATNSRPLPKSPVTELSTEEVQELIGIKGDLLVGRLAGYEAVKVLFDSQDKKVIPRNIGIFGTVGSGKTNTAQVLIEEVAAQGYAVVVIDVEGEYVSMNQPTDKLKEKLASFGLEPEGLKDFHVFFPVAGESRYSKATPFQIPFHTMNPFILSEVLNFSEAQERVFFELVGRLQSPGKKKKGEAKEEGAPKDEVLAFITGSSGKGEEGYTAAKAIQTLFAMAEDQRGGERAASYTLSKKLAKLRREGIFDQEGVAQLQVPTMLKAGRVSIIDVSGSNDEVKNIVIAWLLEKVFDLKMNEPEKTPKTLVLVEEAHTFVSLENKDRMAATLDMIRIISRRGRKRWLCLGFISQQPAHLPSEIFELCNTRFIHVTKSQPNIFALKSTGGDVVEELWNQLPSLGVGQALVSSPQFNHSVMVDIRPAKSKRELVD